MNEPDHSDWNRALADMPYATVITVLVKHMTAEEIEAAGMKLLDYAGSQPLNSPARKFYRETARALAKEIEDRGDAAKLQVDPPQKYPGR